MAKLNVRIDDELDVDLEVAVARRKTTKQAATTAALRSWLTSIANSGNPPLTENSSQTAKSGDSLTEDQRDILAILAEDPSRGFLFQAVQTTVKHALEGYREKWKSKGSGKKAARRVDDKRAAS